MVGDMGEETDKKSDEFKSAMNVNSEISNMLDCLLSSAKKTCKQCRKVNTCSILMEAVIAYRNQMNKHDPHG